MKPSRPPTFETRRASELEAELFARARAWIPSWSLENDERDFGRALLKIAARFGSEVTERLDRAGEKLRLGFLDWLAMPTEAARPARLPVVFKLTDKAREAKPAAALTRLQASAAGASVMLETETDVLVLPRQLQVLVGVDAGADAFYLPPPGLTSLAPLEALPTQWQLKSFASAGATTLQVDPEQGLAVDMLIELGGLQYSITKVKGNVVTVDPPLTDDQAEQSVVTKATAFIPFDGAARNRQQHALYIGHKDLFNIEAAATIEIVGAKRLSDVTWEYWSKGDPLLEDGWQKLEFASPEEQAKADGLVLTKPKGPIEMRALVKGGSESRWIRASANTVKPGDPPLLVDAFEIRINCRDGAPAPLSTDPSAAPTAEAMANTTPLVLDSVFFPFGKEPRQFDTFYLGSKEAFSKKGAEVVLDFELADTTFTALSLVRGGSVDPVLAGVAQDGALHLLQVDASTGVISKFREREPLRPPPGDGNTAATLGVQLDRRPRGRAPVWQDAQGFLVAAAAADAVWVWQENSTKQNDSRWLPFGSVPSSAADPTATIDDLVYLTDTSMLFALRGGQLSARKWPDGPQWTPLETKDGAQAVVLKAIVPVLTVSGDSLATSAAAGMVGVADDKSLYEVKPTGICSKLSPADVSAEVRPLAVQRAADLIVVLAHSASTDLSVFHSVHGEKAIPLPEPQAAAKGFDAVVKNGALHYLASVQVPSGSYLASWTPHGAPGDDINLLRAPIPADLGQPDGAPTAIGGHVVVPGRGGDLLVADLDLTQRLELQADVGEGVFTADPAPQFAPNDLVAREIGASAFDAQLITQTGVTPEKQAFYLLSAPFATAASGPLHGVHLIDAPRSGDLKKVGTLQLETDDRTTLVNGLVRVGTALYRVTGISASNLATLTPNPPADASSQPYWSSAPITGRFAPFIRPTNNNWDAALLDRAVLLFKDSSPTQRGKAFSIGAGNSPLLIELSTPWTTAPAVVIAAPFVLDAAVGAWSRSLGDTSTNPELSWEYWNGAGWWKLVVTRDDTLRLKKSGQLHFTVPADLSPTDWSGRTNYWIRARLIGGDYGRESVSVANSPRDAKGFTHQTVERSTENIHPPSVVRLSISYEICESVLPDFVMTRDSGSLRDQSDANRTGGATVEAFVPLAVQLARLSGPPAADAAAADSCKPDCHCPTTTTVGAVSAAPVSSALAPASQSASTTATAGGRALYLGFDAPLLGEQVNVLLLVEERLHDDFAPMTVEVLIANRFVPVTVDDATRALGESGVLSMTFAIQATPRDLFGQTLAWLRLTPKATVSSTNWKPKVLGAYLNGVWASAAETLTRERVGSSQGEPNLTLFLARPPVLRNTLELRVREPLGEEERKALNDERAGQVLSAVENLPGDWVVWKRVIDPADEEPTARVYALDEATGEIRFGDGRHGRIPPVGSDAIVAFTYRRTDAGVPESTVTSESTGTPRVIVVPGNTITARTSLNLVSPIEGVEAVFAADQGGGGAPPEDVDRVLRYGVAGLRHRERALTARDIEDLVLESSPDIAQARCFARNGFVQLIVVMRGANPLPTAAQVRELHRMLVAEAPPTLSARHALRIGGPALRRLRVDLKLRVASLDVAGAVARDARKHISALFDAATGGTDKEGWALGENPSGADVAVALANVPRLESIAAVDLREIAPDGSDQRWPQTLKRNELAWLEKDGVRIEFEAIEVLA